MSFGLSGKQALRQNQMCKRFIGGTLYKNKSGRKQNWAETASDLDTDLSKF